MSAWVVLRRSSVKRAAVGDGGSSVFEWVREPGMPEYVTRAEAIRAITVVMCDLRADAPDEQVKQQWSRYRSNVRHHKVARAAETGATQ